MLEEQKIKITNVITSMVDAASLELVDLIFKNQGRSTTIEVLADKPHGGITIEECSNINRQIIRELELQHVLLDDYAVEVSSPGLDRPLKTEKDFRRLIGWDVHFYLAERVNDRLEHEGKIITATQENVLIQTPQGEVIIPFLVINKAYQVF